MRVLISEVGPRDGLQSIKRSMPTEAKHRWIRALAGAGLGEIEVASFVPPKLLPQMADAAAVVREAVAWWCSLLLPICAVSRTPRRRAPTK
jgi:hydroxymethylglutaryl-CoA lyase